MPPEPAPLLDGMVRVLDVERFRDARGSLVPIDFDEIGFRVVRTFVVDAPRGVVRGGHAHRRVRQVLLRASGTIEVEVRHDRGRQRVVLDEAHPALLLEPGVWAQQTYVDDHAVLVVFADGPFDAEEYVHDRPDAGEEPT